MIYVGNISTTTCAAQLKSLFAAFGEVADAIVIMDEETDRSRNYGYVLMENDVCALEAIQYLHNRNFMNRYLEVYEVEGGDKMKPFLS